MGSKYSSLEFFAGAGGLALGLEKAGFDSKLLLDIDRDSCLTLTKNRPNLNVVQEDIVSFATYTNLMNYTDIDLISGGFPCQPFSYAGKKRGLEDTRGTLFFSLASIINAIRPKVALLENVKGLLRHNQGETFTSILSSLVSIGYTPHYKVLNANDFDVAQKRERLFIVAIRKDLPQSYAFPSPLNNPKLMLKDILNNVPKSEGYDYPQHKKRVLALVPQGGCHRDLPVEAAKMYMGKSFYSGGGRTGMARRLSWNEPSLTLTTSPVQKQTERCHPDETRPFTIREYARIQSFPDDYEFVGSIASVYRQIGNAVPVNLAYHVATSIKNYLSHLKKEGL